MSPNNKKNKLPKLTLPVHNITLPISKEKLEIQPFVIKNEKSLLTSIDPEDKKGAVKLFKSLIDECVISEVFEVNTLNIVDFYYLILNIRMKSNGEMIDGQLQCEHCFKQTEFEINLENSILIKNPENLSCTIKMNDQLSLKLVPANIKSLFDEEEIVVQDLVAGSVDTVVIDGKIYKDFTPDELIENIFCIFTKMDYEKISKEMESLARLYISFDYDCVNCGENNNYETDDISNFK